MPISINTYTNTYWMFWKQFIPSRYWYLILTKSFLKLSYQPSFRVYGWFLVGMWEEYIILYPAIHWTWINNPNLVYNGGISPGQKWWWPVLEIEISCSPCKGSACIQSALIFFSFKFWVGKGEGEFFFIFFVPNMFLSNSQCVPQGCSQ